MTPIAWLSRCNCSDESQYCSAQGAIPRIREGRKDTWFTNKLSCNKVPQGLLFAGIKGKETLTIGEVQFEGINDFNTL
jgi:hypothetical protein